MSALKMFHFEVTNELTKETISFTRGWKCRAWTTDFRMVDACPKCIPSFNFGRRVDILGLTTKQK